MQGFATLILAIAAIVDNFAIGTAYGNKALRIGNRTNGFIALVSGLGTFLSMSVGKEISSYLTAIQSAKLGSFALVTAGVWGLWAVFQREQKQAKRLSFLRQELQAESANISNISVSKIANSSQEETDKCLEEFAYETFLENPERADRDRSGYIDIYESITLAFGLSVNNLAIGIGAGISGYSAIVTAGLVILFSFSGLALGYILGNRFALKMPGLWAGLLSGGMVILTGIYGFLSQ
ncbi:hypothetical protein [Floridanema evergladense]|uniref:Sporulation protein YtaF n=1 Tax=Floridaenema evergladense BLCC-F167 TaxID=3153639 RepID=A0ABV4WW46_9CYAN